MKKSVLNVSFLVIILSNSFNHILYQKEFIKFFQSNVIVINIVQISARFIDVPCKSWLSPFTKVTCSHINSMIISIQMSLNGIGTSSWRLCFPNLEAITLVGRDLWQIFSKSREDVIIDFRIILNLLGISYRSCCPNLLFIAFVEREL